jgi:hypothetical protein
MAPITSIRLTATMISAVAALAGGPAKADPFLVNMTNSGVQGPTTLLEATPPTVTYSITVTNPDRVDPILLDFALVTTIPVGGDPTDVISFPTVVQFPATIAAGGKGTFIYSVTNGDDPFDGTDSGLTDFSFSAEYSVITGGVNTPTQFLGTMGGALMVQGSTSGVQDPATFAELMGCLANPVACSNPPGHFLYPPSLNMANPAFGTFASTAVRVNDVPEPSSWALMLLGFAGLGVAMRRRKGDLTRLRAAPARVL